jgi:hypothetical protein
MKSRRSQVSRPREALTREPLQDSYHATAKLHGPAECPSCHASYRAGRWTWAKPAADAAAHRCPACARIDDDMPAGYVALKGGFLPAHRDEILGVVKAREEHARAEHPLQRIMAVQPTPDGILVTTTDVHLARGIAHAVHQAFKGELAMRYSKAENLLRATWKR